MRDLIFRVLIAAVISLAGIFATYTWSRAHRVGLGLSESEEPVARIASSNNEVQRRPAQRFIWQSILKNQELYPGEAVRTASNADARIEFIGQGTVIQLDADTVIEIEKRQDGINLDFLKGNLVIRSAAPSDKIMVKSGGEKLAVANAEVAISKSLSSDAMDVDVVKGEVRRLLNDDLEESVELKPTDGKVSKKKTEARGQVITPNSQPSARLKLLKPRVGEPWYMASNADEPVEVQWSPIDPSYEVSLELGETRTELKGTAIKKSATGIEGRLAYPMQIGDKGFLKLVARSSRGLPELESSIVHYEVRAKQAPLPLEPAPGATARFVTPEKGVREVLLRWANPGALTDLMVETARSRDLRLSLVAKNVGEAVSYQTDFGQMPGFVYWRVSGRLPGTNQMVSSPVQEFYLPSEKGEAAPLLKPTLLLPKDQSLSTALAAAGSGINLRWQPVQSAIKYELTLHERVSVGDGNAELKNHTRESTATEVNVKGLKPGAYSWSVIAIDENGRRSPASIEWRFTIEGLPMLSWHDGRTRDRVVFKGQKPFLNVAWTRGPQEAVNWRVRVVSTRLPASVGGAPQPEAPWKPTSQPHLQEVLPQAGLYRIEAEALDKEGRVVASAPARTIEFEPAPPLSAPDFAASIKKEIEGSESGDVDIAWLPIQDAKQYVITLKNKDGTTVKSQKTAGLKMHFNAVPTGEYKVVLQSIDAEGRIGPEGETRMVKVPEYSDVAAPKIKAVNVK